MAPIMTEASKSPPVEDVVDAARDVAEQVEQRVFAQAAQVAEALRTTSLAAYDAFIDAYDHTLQLNRQAQLRPLRHARRILEEEFGLQAELRDLAQQWVSSARKTQQSLYEASKRVVA